MNIRKPYPTEFRHEAVKRVTEQGMALSQVARDLDIDSDTVRRWIRAAGGKIGLPVLRVEHC